jgi:hypothetical protein
VPAFFVTRAKSNTKFKRLYSRPVDKATGMICDQTISLTGFYTRQDYPEKLRRVKLRDAQTKRTFVFLTNNFSLPALTIVQLYRSRWAGRAVFQKDKATPQNKNRNIRECGEVPNLNCRISLCACDHNEEMTQLSRKSLHNFTNFERVSIRKNTDLSNDY